MNIVIVGQGAIGLLLYGHLINNEQLCVSLLSSSAAFTQHQHFTFKNLQGATQAIGLRHARLNDLAHTDIIIYATKSYQLERALTNTLPYLHKNASIIYAHNGMVNLAALPFTIEQQQLALLLTHGCKKLTEQTIEHTGKGHIDLGYLACARQTSQTSRKKPAIPHPIVAVFQQAMPECYWHSNIEKVQWLKLAINCVINPITTIYNIENGQVRDIKYRASIMKIIEEVRLVAQSQQIRLKAEDLVETALMVAEKTQRNSSSMRCDMLNHRRTEIEFINGYIVELGRLSGVKTPENVKLIKQVLALSKS